MLKLYSAPATRSIRIAWLLEEMGVQYELENRTLTPTSDKFFAQDTPTGKFPTLDDDGFIMFESGAITEYLLEKYDGHNLAPAPGSPLRGEFLKWLHFADATAYAPIGVYVWLVIYRDDAAEHPQMIEDAKARAVTGLKVLEQHIDGRQYLLGDDFSAADVMMGFTLLAARMLGVMPADSPLDDYLDRLVARPAFVTAATKTGNDGLLPG